jgi:hypothetical protein
MKTAKTLTRYNDVLSAIRSLNKEERRRLVEELNREQMRDILTQMPSIEGGGEMDSVVEEIKLSRKERNEKKGRP